VNTSNFDCATWRKSSYSSHNGSCVEVAWRKSSYSGHNGSCVEVAAIGSLVGVRDSKSTTTGNLALATGGWHKFVDAVKHDQLAQ
jgi:hypothetical protein